MKRKWTLILIGLLILAVGVGVGVYAANNYGTQSDPLITKSYLDEVVQPELEQELQTALDGAVREVESASGTFRKLELVSGQKLTCSIGTEFLLRSGSATAVGSLSDTTAGSAVSAGSALQSNHLYLAADIGAGLTASGGAVILISGDYSLG